MDLSLPHQQDRTFEIRDVIHGSISISPEERRIIDSPFFQRLRSIKQLGFSELAYPCATHNRYSHSIGAMHLAGKAFQNIFQGETFSSKQVYFNYLRLVRLATLLHDVGHGPLSHAIEFAMPPVSTLNLGSEIVGNEETRQASHEDYTLKIILKSSMSPLIRSEYEKFEITPEHVAAVVSLDLPEPDDFFIDKNVNYRKILHQLVSSEIDADRMDYLQRDSYYTGVSYGKYDLDWLLSNLTYHTTPDEQDPRNPATAHLTLSNRAIYTFEDFLLSRYHMFLMVYYHHRSIVYEQMLERYLRGKDCSLQIPSDIEAYVNFDDSYLWQHLKSRSDNEWARRIVKHEPYRLTFELHSSGTPEAALSVAAHYGASAFPVELDPRFRALKKYLDENKIDYIQTHNRGLVSKYTGAGTTPGKNSDIFVMVGDRLTDVQFVPLTSFTELFQRYESSKDILRVFTAERVSLPEINY